MLFDKLRFIADVLVMQETHSSEQDVQIWANEWGGKAIFSHGTTAARGIAVFTSKELYSSFKNITIDTQGRTIIWDMTQNDQHVTIAAIYAPNEDQPQYFTDIRNTLRNRNENKIIIGDFNMTLNNDLDRLNTYCNNNKAKEEVLDIMDEFCLNDTWRTQYPNQKEYSWFKGNSHLQKASRIDYALVSAGLDQRVMNPMYVSAAMTDHRAIYMAIDLAYSERGKGYWKMNTQLITEKAFITMMNTEIQQCLQENISLSAQENWEFLKQKIKKVSIKYAKNKTSENKIIISQLSEVVNEYEANLPLNQSDFDMWQQTKADLEEKLLERTRGIMFRSKVRWYEQGERNTKYFVSLEKSRYNAKTCFKLINEEGHEVIESDQILEKHRRFYQNLYKKDQHVEFNMENTYGIYVPDNIKQNQNQQLTIEELGEAVKNMSNNKTPGEDGIPVDFYKVFWPYIKQAFYNMVMDCFREDTLHPTARKGILNLIPKANKDTRFIKNLRPITLLNVDYKIIEKAVANKMIPALEHIIHRDQRGFMKERRISVNIRKMLDIIHEANTQDLEAVVLSLDFVKCFDKCSFSILHGSLDFFGFGEIVKQWTRILYKDFTVRIQNNGHFSDIIPINKGVHQGGCCSSIYFLVIAEILALSIRQNSEIEGITIKDINNILNQFADDMDIFSLCTQQSITAIFEELNKFHQQSGFEISYEKTTMYRIGSLRHSCATLYNQDQVAWSNKDINVLGITIAHENLVEKNYHNMAEKVKQVLNAWHNRGLSLIGRIQVINSLIASLFVYKMMVLPNIPNSILKNIDNILRDFLWDGKKSKIALNILQNPKSEGGLALVNLRNKEKALKATWPQILASEREYAQIAYSALKASTIKEDIWRCSIKKEDVQKMKITSDFWKQVLAAWSEYNYYLNQRVENQIIWYNSSIRIQNKIFFWRNNYTKGLVYVHQLFREGHFKTEEQVYQEFALTKMRYNSIKSAIPKDWKEFFMDTPHITFLPMAPHNYDQAIGQEKSGLSAKIYHRINGDKFLVQRKFIKWVEEVGPSFSANLWEFCQSHRSIYQITNVPKYRSFQYRIYQRALVTNIDLERWNIIDTNLCNFCQEQEETVLHLLTQCPCITPIWDKIIEYIKNEFKCKEIFTNPAALLKSQIVEKKGHVANLISLVFKQYIYRQKCLKDTVTFQAFMAHLRKIENIEKFIAVKNNRVAQHHAKWKNTQPVDVSQVIEEFLNDRS